MQNYHNFINELFRLTIHTVQYFVSNGQVLYGQLPEWYPTDTPADRLPGYVSSFMSLDQYHESQREDRYADKLVEMQRQAITDLLLLDSMQINRLLIDLKNKNERLLQLLKNATKYESAWQNDTLDSLPSAFLELYLLDGFIIKIRPEASPHIRFAQCLKDAIMYKRSVLSGLIKQVELVMNSHEERMTADSIVSNSQSHMSAVDKTYFLTTDFKAPRYGKEEDLKNPKYGPSYQVNIEGVECAIYTDRLNWFLQSTQIKVADIEADYADFTIDGTSYRQSYKNGFSEGIINFDKKYSFEKYAQLLGIEKYIETLRSIKFNECMGPLWSPGLEGIRHSHLGSINHKIIRDHGYYAGMYSQVERLMKNYEPIKKALSVYPVGYLSDSVTSKQVPSTETKKQPTQRESTKKRHQQYREDFDNFQSLEGKNRLDAIRLTAEKHRASIDTVERALGLKK